jgi:hypothetical protein
VRVFALTLGVLLAVVVGVNVVGGWTAARDESRVQAVAAALRPGEAVLGYLNVDERRFQRARLRVIERPQVIVFGSSRAMQVNGEMIGVAPPGFYNLGMSAATVEDFVGLWETLRRQEKIPERVIFSLDPWMLNPQSNRVRWRVLAREVDAFKASHGRWASGGRWGIVDVAHASWNRATELLSYEVLRESTRRLQRALRGRSGVAAGSTETLIVPEPAVGDRQALRADGSMIYDGTFQRRSPLEVQEDAVHWAATRLSLNPGRERLRLLEALWRDLLGRGVQITAYTPPFHPAAWQVMVAVPRQREALEEALTSIAGLAARMNVPFRDFADPATIPCAAEEFSDGAHPRLSCLEKLFRRLSSRD